MRDHGRSMLRDVLPPEERAIENVVSRYQRVAPAVTRFARSIAGDDDLQVRLGSHAEARAGEIVLDPGVFQAAYARAAPVTPGEVALASALHEAVHLVATDFDERRPMPPEWYPHSYEGEVSEEPVALLDGLVSAGGPAAAALFLTVEDARQEATLLQAYAGARSVIGDLYAAASPKTLGDARPLGQYGLACFLLVGGYEDREDLERRVSPPVAAALDDATPFLEDIAASTDPWEVAGSALHLLAVARLHGLAEEITDAETPQTRAAREELQAVDIIETVDMVRLTTPVLRDPESYDDTHQVVGPEGRQADVVPGGDPATDQIVRVSEAPTVYLPDGRGGKLVVAGFPDAFRTFSAEGHTALEEAARRWAVAQRHVSGELFPLFTANQRRGLQAGFDAGDLSPYSALLLGGGLYERMFERRASSTRRSYALSLLVDGSASMLQPREIPSAGRVAWALAAATLGAWTLARLCDELQVEFEVALFNRAFAAAAVDTEATFTTRLHAATGGLRRTQGGHADRLTRTINHYLIKPFDRPWRNAEDVLAGLFWAASNPAQAAQQARRDPRMAPPVSMFEKAANVDEFNVSHAAGRLVARRAETRVLVVLADGMTRGSVETLASAVEEVERCGTLVLGIGIGDATVEAAYGRHQIVERPDTLATAMVDGVRSALYRSIAATGGDSWWIHRSERGLYDRGVTRRNDG